MNLSDLDLGFVKSKAGNSIEYSFIHSIKINLSQVKLQQ